MATKSQKLPIYSGGLQPQYEYNPNNGYIVPGQFDDASSSEDEASPGAAKSTKAPSSAPVNPPAAAVQPATAEEEVYEEEYYDDEEDSEDDRKFDDALNGEDWGSNTGDFTKSYNRQRRIVEATNPTNPSTGQGARTNSQKPKANVSASVDDQISSLAKFAARIKLTAAESGLAGKSGGYVQTQTHTYKEGNNIKS